LLLLLDLSGSTARVTDTIRAAARRFVAATRSQDRVAVITFAGEQSVVSPPTSDRVALASAIDRIAPPKGDTRLYDSLAYAHDRLEELAGAGGGAFYEVEKLEDLAGAYELVVADLGTVYSLSYRPTNRQRDGRWRAIRVTLPRLSNAVARGKRGYVAK